MNIEGFDASRLTDLWVQYGLNVVGAILILIVGWVVASWASRLTRAGLSRSGRVDDTVSVVLSRVVRWLVLAFTLVAVLNRFGVQTTSIVALLGAAGLAIGLALQGTLANVAAGIMVLMLRPFRLGDAVDIGGTGGTVEDIGLFTTRITSFDGVVVHVPNGQVWGEKIQNYSQAGKRRYDLVVGIGYGDDIGKALNAMRAVVSSDDRVLADPEPMYVVTELGDSAVNVMARYWVAPADYWTARFELTRSVKERFDGEGINIPFPQRDLHLAPGATLKVEQA
ncbi:MAG: mechanosensitive ion channel [Trueperaceae bacterium]